METNLDYAGYWDNNEVEDVNTLIRLFKARVVKGREVVQALNRIGDRWVIAVTGGNI